MQPASAIPVKQSPINDRIFFISFPSVNAFDCGGPSRIHSAKTAVGHAETLAARWHHPNRIIPPPTSADPQVDKASRPPDAPAARPHFLDRQNLQSEYSLDRDIQD